MRDISVERCAAGRPALIVPSVPPRRALLVAGAGLAAGLIVQYLFVRERAGGNVVVATALLLGLGWLARGDGDRAGRSERAAAALAVVFASLVAVRADVAVVWFDIAAAIAFGAAFFVAATGTSLGLPLLGVLRRAVAVVGATVIDAPPAWIAAAPAARSSLGHAAPFGGYAAGLALALPFVVVFSALFSAADAVFERSVRDVLDLAWLRELIRDIPVRVLVAAMAGWSATGVYAYVLMSRAKTRTSGGERDRVPRLISADPVLVALFVLDALFAAFVALQGAYLFGGRDTLDAAGVTYSAYGRRGFFELVAVSALVAALLFAFDLTVRAHRRSYVTAALLLLVLTGAILVSAAYRMSLYQLAYGWTELRLYTFAAMAFLALALAIFAWAVLTRCMEYVLVPLVMAAAAVALAVNVIAPSDYVARRNIERVLDPRSLPEDASRGLDVPHLLSLGDGAMPALFELAPDLPEPERSVLFDALRVATLRRDVAGWQSWNLDRERARGVVVRASGQGAFTR